MGWDIPSTRRDISRWPFRWTGAVAAKAMQVFGAYGTDVGTRYSGDEGRCLAWALIHNTGTVTLRVAESIPDLQIRGLYTELEPGATLEIYNQISGLAVWNPDASTAGSVTMQGEADRTPNVRTSANAGHPGEMAELDAVVEGVAGSAVAKTITVPYALTITAIKLWAEAVPSSAAGTYLFAATGAGNNLLGAATFDLETLTAATVETLALTGTGADLVLAEGDSVVFTATSDNADLANGTFVIATTFTA